MDKLAKHKFVINVSAIVRFPKVGNRVIIQKRSVKEETNPGKWCIPGGKLDFEDGSVEAGVRREVKEELNIKIENIKLFESHVTHDQHENQKIYLVFTADYKSGAIKIDTNEVETYTYVKNTKLPNGDEFIPFTKEILEDYFKREGEIKND